MNFHNELKLNMHKYVRLIYRLTRNFPKEEIYGVVSQIRRATLSIILNYIEGFARRKGKNCSTPAMMTKRKPSIDNVTPIANRTG